MHLSMDFKEAKFTPKGCKHFTGLWHAPQRLLRNKCFATYTEIISSPTQILQVNYSVTSRNVEVKLKTFQGNSFKHKANLAIKLPHLMVKEKCKDPWSSYP